MTTTFSKPATYFKGNPSRYPGFCSACHKTYPAGTKCNSVPGTNVWVHVDCLDKAIADCETTLSVAAALAEGRVPDGWVWDPWCEDYLPPRKETVYEDGWA